MAASRAMAHTPGRPRENDESNASCSRENSSLLFTHHHEQWNSIDDMSRNQHLRFSTNYRGFHGCFDARYSWWQRRWEAAMIMECSFSRQCFLAAFGDFEVAISTRIITSLPQAYLIAPYHFCAMPAEVILAVICYFALDFRWRDIIYLVAFGKCSLRRRKVRGSL